MEASGFIAQSQSRLKRSPLPTLQLSGSDGHTGAGESEIPMKEDLGKVKVLARDFRGDRESPRSPREQLGGYALAARALDKCRATLVGQQGDYFSNCPLDQRWLKFAELEYDAFRSLVATGATDEEVAGWISDHARQRTPAEIAEWNQREGAIQLS